MGKFGTFIKSVFNTSEQAEDSHLVSKGPKFKWLGLNGYGFESYNDEALIRDGYASNSDIYSIITSISKKAADLNFIVNDTKTGEPIESGISFELVNGDDEKAFSTKIEEAMINYGVTGDAFFELIPSVVFSGGFARMDTLRSSSVNIICNVENVITSYTYSDGNTIRTIAPENIIHVKAYNPLEDDNGGHRGMSPLQAGKRVVDASNSAEVASANLFENQGVSGLISDNSDSISDGDEAQQLQNALDKKLGGADKAGKYTVTSANVKVHQLGLSSKDLELSKSGPITLRKMAALFGVSSRQYNDPQGTTYNNAETDAKNFYVNGVMPVLNKITKTISLRFNQIDGSTVVADYSSVEVLQSDKKKEIEKNKLEADAILDVITREIDPKQKLFILTNIHGMIEEDAKLLVNG